MTLTGTYGAAGALSLSFHVTGPGGYDKTATSVAADTDPRTGQFFGFRDNIGGGTAGTLSVDFDNLAITAAVPEPGALAIVAGAFALAGRRRRRA